MRLTHKQFIKKKKTQTDGSKGNCNSTANMVLKVSIQESNHDNYDSYINQCMVYAQGIRNIEIHHLIGFLSAMFDKGVA